MVRSLELWEPATGSWSVAGNLPRIPDEAVSVVALGNGNALIIDEHRPRLRASLWISVDKRLRPAGEGEGSYVGEGPAVVFGNQVISFAHRYFEDHLPHFTSWDGSDRWKKISPPPLEECNANDNAGEVPSCVLAALKFDESRLFIVTLKSIGLWNPDSGQWSPLVPPVQGFNQRAVELPGGRFLILSNRTDSSELVAQLWDSRKNTWKTQHYASSDTGDTQWIAMDSGHVAIIGETQHQIWDPDSNTIKAFAWPQGEGRGLGLSVQGGLLLCGCSSVAISVDSRCHFWNDSQGTLTSTGALIVPRACPSLTLLSDGRVLAVAGYNIHDVSYKSKLYTAFAWFVLIASLGLCIYLLTGSPTRYSKVGVAVGLIIGSVACMVCLGIIAGAIRSGD